MRKLVTAGLALALAFGLSGGAKAQEFVIKFSHVVAPNTPKGKGADRFKELAEKYTDNRVKVEVYPNSQLYKDKEELEALQLGAVQMLAPSLAKFGPLGVREFELFDLPFIFLGNEDLRKITEGPIGEALFSRLEDKGISGLAYWDNGFKIVTSNRPMHEPDDFLGLKMRIQSSKILEAQFEELGAIPQVMAFSEVYQAMQTGVVDGSENTSSNVFTQKVHEVQRHTTLSNHGYIGYAVIVNKAFWDGLPADIRTQLNRAIDEATVYANEIALAENEWALDEIRKSGRTTVYELTDEERAEWVKALQPVHKRMAPQIGTDLIQDVYKALGRES